MKVRAGFVSNSSSSSFLLVGVRIDEEDVEQMGYDKENYCWKENSGWTEYGHGVVGQHEKTDLMIVGVDGEPSFIGIDAEALIKEDKKFSEIVEIFKDKMKKAKIPVVGKPELINDTFGDG